MNKQRYLELLFENGLSYGPKGGSYLTENYEDIDVSAEIKSLLKSSIESNSNFEIPEHHYPHLIDVLNQNIETLLTHPEFDPFKVELRQKFPEQYSSYPFEFNGTTYYLYGKTFAIDSEIERIANLIDIIKEHKKEGVSMRFFYKA